MWTKSGRLKGGIESAKTRHRYAQRNKNIIVCISHLMLLDGVPRHKIVSSISKLSYLSVRTIRNYVGDDKAKPHYSKAIDDLNEIYSEKGYFTDRRYQSYSHPIRENDETWKKLKNLFKKVQ